MAKKTIEQKKQEMQMKLKKLEVIEEVITKVNCMMEWDEMRVKEDENGQPVTDENGCLMYEPPAEDAWNYDKYVAYVEVLEELEGLV